MQLDMWSWKREAFHPDDLESTDTVDSSCKCWKNISLHETALSVLLGAL